MGRILRGARTGLFLVGVAALGLFALVGERSLTLLLLGLLALSLALHLWWLPRALRRGLGGWFRLGRPPLPSPPPIPTATAAARLREEVEATARGLAGAIEGSPPVAPASPAIVFRCPFCGHRLDPREARCAGCGRPADFRCPFCGGPVDPSGGRCPRCGAGLPRG